MIVAYWKTFEDENTLELYQIMVCGFRCGYSEKDPIRERVAVADVLEGIELLKGRKMLMSNTIELDEDGIEIPSTSMPTPSMAMFAQPQPSRLVQSFHDSLIVSLPISITKGSPCQFVAGCRHTQELFQVFTLSYGENSNVCLYEVEEYRKP